jgi:glycosyltransferase involved in cell wall biosynthesis
MVILLIDKNLPISVNRAKWKKLSQLDDVHVYALFPELWVENQREYRGKREANGNFILEPVPVYFTGTENRTFYHFRKFMFSSRPKPDVILCFEEPFSLFALQTVFMKLLRYRDVPLVLHSWYNFPERTIRSYRPGWLYTLIERFVVRFTSLVFGANKEAVDRYRQLGVPSELLHFALDLDTFAPPPEVLPKGDFRIGFVGRLEQFKGVDLLLRAFALASLPDNATLTIVGSGSAGHELQQLAKSLHLTNRVVFSDFVAPENVPEVMHSLSVFVLPSRTTWTWTEQLGRVLIEAMAAGVPVIGSSSGSIPSVIGNAGLVFQEDNAEDLARCIVQLYQDPTLYQDLVDRGKQQASLYRGEVFAQHVERRLREIRLDSD